MYSVIEISDVDRKEEIPPPCYDSFSAIYNNQLIVIGGIIEKKQRDFNEIYSLDLGM